MQPSQNCYELIKHFEGCKLQAYKDAAGVWTIGFGNTFFESGRSVKKGDTITQGRADALLQTIVEKFAAAVNQLVKREISQQQFDALVSFCYNLGQGNLAKSTLLRKLNSGSPDSEVAAEFAKWRIAGGKVLKGLIRRRKSEAHLFLTGEINFFI